MTIYNAKWRQEFHGRVLPRLSAAHPDLTRIAAKLRDPAVEVWTESPSDDSKITASESYSLEGWRVHYGTERSQLQQWRTAHGTALNNYDPQGLTALDGYLASIPNIGTVMATIMANYTNAEGRLIQDKVAQTDRDTLAAAIEAELA